MQGHCAVAGRDAVPGPAARREALLETPQIVAGGGNPGRQERVEKIAELGMRKVGLGDREAPPVAAFHHADEAAAGVKRGCEGGRRCNRRRQIAKRDRLQMRTLPDRAAHRIERYLAEQEPIRVGHEDQTGAIVQRTLYPGPQRVAGQCLEGHVARSHGAVGRQIIGHLSQGAGHVRVARDLQDFDGLGRTGEAGEEQHQAVLQLDPPFGRHMQGRDAEIPAREEVDPVQPAKCRGHLILGADSFLQQLLLHMDCFLRQEALGTKALMISEPCIQQGDGEGRTRPKTGLRWQICVVYYFVSGLSVTVVMFEKTSNNRVL